MNPLLPAVNQVTKRQFNKASQQQVATMLVHGLHTWPPAQDSNHITVMGTHWRFCNLQGAVWVATCSHTTVHKFPDCFIPSQVLLSPSPLTLLNELLAFSILHAFSIVHIHLMMNVYIYILTKLVCINHWFKLFWIGLYLIATLSYRICLHIARWFNMNKCQLQDNLQQTVQSSLPYLIMYACYCSFLPVS